MSTGVSGAAGRCATTCRGNKFRVIFSDVCNATAIGLMIITLGASATDPKNAFSWTRFKYFNNLPYRNPCTTLDLGTKFEGPLNDCVAAGKGVIAAASFAMLFGLLSIIWLHIFTSFRQWCKCRIPFPRAFIAFFSFMSLTLYIVAVATWYSQCHSHVEDSAWRAYEGAKPQGAQDVVPGYAVALAILVIVLSFVAWVYNFSRTCFPNKNEPTPPQAAASYGQSTAGLAAQGGEGQTYGYGGDSEGAGYNAPSPSAGSGGGGGYGGSYGGAYGQGNAGYGYGGGAGGASAGGYGGAYGGAGGAYSNSNQSAYG